MTAWLNPGIKVVECPFWSKHPTRTYVSAYIQAHPMVVKMCWVLRRWIWIKPWVEIETPDEADAIYVDPHNTLYMGPKTYKRFRDLQITQN